MLRNRKELEQGRLKGVDLQADDSDISLGSFTALNNYIPTNVFSIKKKRGVVAFSTTETPPVLPITLYHPFIDPVRSVLADALTTMPYYLATGANPEGERVHHLLMLGL